MNFMFQVAANPFKNWAHLAVKTPAKALREDFFNTSTASNGAGTSGTGGNKRGRKRRDPCQ